MNVPPVLLIILIFCCMFESAIIPINKYHYVMLGLVFNLETNNSTFISVLNLMFTPDIFDDLVSDVF